MSWALFLRYHRRINSWCRRCRCGGGGGGGCGGVIYKCFSFAQMKTLLTAWGLIISSHKLRRYFYVTQGHVNHSHGKWSLKSGKVEMLREKFLKKKQDCEFVFHKKEAFFLIEDSENKATISLWKCLSNDRYFRNCYGSSVWHKTIVFFSPNR